MNILRIGSMIQIPENFTGIVEYPNGTKFWYKNSKWHREDGPACEWTDGEKHWFLEGKEFYPLNLNNFVVLDHDKREYDPMWYRLLAEDKIFEYPDIPGLITK